MLRIEEPAARRPAPASLGAWLALGFRPLYLLGAAWAAIAIALWTFAPQALPATMGGLAWHAHEMLWGFVATIAAGFLMTAGANWTGLNPLPPPWLGAAVVLWAAARVGLLVDHGAAYAVGAMAELAFFALAAAGLGQAVARARNRRNAGLPLALLALAAADAAFLWQVHRGDVATALGWVQVGIGVMALVALLIARRVTPFFAMRAVPGLQVPLHQRSGQVQLATAGAGIVAAVAGWRWPAAAAMAAAGAIALWQVASWRPAAVRTRPILWILYLGHAGLGAGLIVAAAHLAGLVGARAAHVHVIALLGFGVLIVGMITRTALGHLGRALVLDRSMVASYALVVAAAALRLGALAATPLAPWLLQASALAWVAAFALYLWRFAPWLVRPRADGRPG